MHEKRRKLPKRMDYTNMVLSHLNRLNYLYSQYIEVSITNILRLDSALHALECVVYPYMVVVRPKGSPARGKRGNTFATEQDTKELKTINNELTKLDIRKHDEAVSMKRLLDKKLKFLCVMLRKIGAFPDYPEQKTEV